MALSQMEVFNKYYMTATIETLGQMIEKFNANSGGAIRLTTGGFEGDFLQESFFAAIHAAQRRVDRYAAQAPAAATDLTELKHNSVKIAGGFGPICYEPSQMTWLLRPTAQGVEVASRNFAEALLADQLNTALNALASAIGNVAGLTNDVSGTGTVDYLAINGAHAKFGDRSGDIVADVMTGQQYHKMLGDNIANANTLFEQGNVRVVENVLGKRVIVTDAPALFEAGTPDKAKVLSLVQGAAIVTDAGDVISNIQTVNGQSRIETTLQLDYTFGLGLKGFAWDIANGGKSPSNAALATGSNWDMIVSDKKHTAGVITIGQA
jgi:hypothetical protein